ncbi:hypothetical protein BT67DRAFT_486934 [Trichocladium antarcticum]|uniref:Uncharacterized protein n=1 Tax=Trichocladium antarcticum TaxID=1450529 RepID=A0AAN6ZAU6_9PEZI|nr:hypothetical protein BT67DRAFT_486934 [Trichocladium antarcticum]
MLMTAECPPASPSSLLLETVTVGRQIQTAYTPCFRGGRVWLGRVAIHFSGVVAVRGRLVTAPSSMATGQQPLAGGVQVTSPSGRSYVVDEIIYQQSRGSLLCCLYRAR